MIDYTLDHLTPYILGTEDVGMACELGVSMGPFLMSFERVIDRPDQASVATMVTAALCAEQKAWDEELRALRAFKDQRVAEYKDARIAQKRAHGVAAHRYYLAYQRMVSRYGVTCKEEEVGEIDQLTMVMGMIAGIQAVQHDRASGVMVNVPTDTPRKVARLSQCLESETWWGVPKALEAAVWLVVPNSGPKGSSEEIRAKAYEVFETQARIGHRVGVRLVDSIFAYGAYAVGDLKKVKEVISRHAKEVDETPAHQRWRLLDRTSTYQIQALSDKLWTEAKGHRTPHGELGEFWDVEGSGSASEGEDEGDDDLFDDLDAEE